MKWGNNWFNLDTFIVFLCSNCSLDSKKMGFLSWDLKKHIKSALKKSHNLPYNGPFWPRSFPWQCRRISHFLPHPIRSPVKNIWGTFLGSYKICVYIIIFICFYSQSKPIKANYSWRSTNFYRMQGPTLFKVWSYWDLMKVILIM